MGEFNSDDHYIYYYCRQDPLEGTGLAFKESKMQFWGAISRRTE